EGTRQTSTVVERKCWVLFHSDENDELQTRTTCKSTDRRISDAFIKFSEKEWIFDGLMLRAFKRDNREREDVASRIRGRGDQRRE
ncbi:hypothetical protein LINPERPRIM_LOCUS13526, partial [Linum perenne]